MQVSAKNFAIRENNACNDFVSAVVEQFGFSKDQAETILAVYRRLKVVKLDPIIGKFCLKDGRFWDRLVMERALVA